jgi:hypothetical protein
LSQLGRQQYGPGLQKFSSIHRYSCVG